MYQVFRDLRGRERAALLAEAAQSAALRGRWVPEARVASVEFWKESAKVTSVAVEPEMLIEDRFLALQKGGAGYHSAAAAALRDEPDWDCSAPTNPLFVLAREGAEAAE